MFFSFDPDFIQILVPAGFLSRNEAIP